MRSASQIRTALVVNRLGLLSGLIPDPPSNGPAHRTPAFRRHPGARRREWPVRAVLILDTGSNTTSLSPEICGLNPVRLPGDEAPQKGTGFVGDGRCGQVAIAIGTTEWRRKRVLIVDIKDLSLAT
jgi:hypothetical protein